MLHTSCCLSLSFCPTLANSLNCCDYLLVLWVWNWLFKWICLATFTFVYFQFQHSFVWSVSSCAIWTCSTNTSVSISIDTWLSELACSTYMWLPRFAWINSRSNWWSAYLSTQLQLLEAIIQVRWFTLCSLWCDFLAWICWTVRTVIALFLYKLKLFYDLLVLGLCLLQLGLTNLEISVNSRNFTVFLVQDVLEFFLQFTLCLFKFVFGLQN